MAEEEVEEKKSKGGLIKIILFAVGGIVLVVIGLGAGYFVFGSSQPDPSEEIETIIERKLQEAEAAKAEQDNASPEKVSKETPEQENFVTIYYEFPGTFTTNLRGSRKMLQVGVGVSTQYDDTVMMNVESHELALRSTILGVLSEFAEEDVQGTNGKAALAAALKQGINSKLILLENFGGVEEVLFTSFVLN
ncbi:flagellar basal body-associated FliL family protein [Alphaproteobacteria bacterium]|jgi:flagellar protein FliL|nr:flagellar basal body-associated FliL family protein [Alphaproteobacteria bacterium]MDC0395129.1 flagellar basal body-associated FliL family protein [Alphaproteobacteria bacterium]MDC3311914.1 flagellar basal body-associated FliL family protein [Alphaproteobacteria bacterium]